MRTGRLILLAVATGWSATAAAWTVPAPAQPPPAPAPASPAPAGTAAPAPSAAAQAQARLHFQQGVALYKERNYDAALAEFQGAYAISAEPIVLYNLGLTYKALFRYGEAVDTLEKYLADSAARGQAVTKARRAEVEGLAAEMRSLLADVTMVVRPPDAVLRIDGRPVTMGIEGIVRLSAGSHAVEATAPDHAPARRDIVVVAHTPQTVTLTLTPIPRTGHVRITASEIGARVDVDGRTLGPAPVEVDLLAGGHQVEVTAPGFTPGRSELVVAAGQTRTVSITLERPAASTGSQSFYNRWWFWAGAGVAAAAVAAIILVPQPTQGPVSGTLGTARTDP
jgi:hypothetical protein